MLWLVGLINPLICMKGHMQWCWHQASAQISKCIFKTEMQDPPWFGTRGKKIYLSARSCTKVDTFLMPAASSFCCWSYSRGSTKAISRSTSTPYINCLYLSCDGKIDLTCNPSLREDCAWQIWLAGIEFYCSFLCKKIGSCIHSWCQALYRKLRFGWLSPLTKLWMGNEI